MILLAGGALLAGGCNQSGDGANVAANTVGNAAAAAPKTKHYCFFRKEDSKGWAAKRDAKGDVTVTGKLHVRDPRYKGDIGQPEISGASAKLWTSYLQNTDQYRSADDWFDVKFTIPNSAAVEKVTVACDSKRTLAELEVKK
jgi:hypothetical protein